MSFMALPFGEDPRTGQRRGFASLEALKQEMGDNDEE